MEKTPNFSIEFIYFAINSYISYNLNVLLYTEYLNN